MAVCVAREVLRPEPRETKGCRLAWALVLTAIAASACGGERSPAPPAASTTDVEPSRIALSVEGRSNASASVAAFGQTVAAVWTASTDNTSDVYVSVSTDGGVTFSAPARVNAIAGAARASGEQSARVMVGYRNAVHVVWPAKHEGHTVIRYAGSKDGGRTFSPAVTVAGASLTGARGWHAATLGYDGGVQVVWLDGRNAAPMAHAHGKGASKPVRPAGGPRQDIFHASWKGDARPVEHLIQSNVCFCCKTAVVASGEKIYAAWRHIYPGSLRDIAVARSTDNGATFGDPVRVSEDGWKIDACPDDGPAMAADGHDGIHIAWPTLVAGDTPRKGIFYSTLKGDTFAPRVRLDSGDADPAHPQIAADHHTNTAIVWDERTSERRRIVFRPVTDGAVAAPQFFDGDGVSYPVVAAGEGYWIVLWSAQDASGGSVIEGRRIPAPAKP
jgi:hypothetical protein